MEFQIFFIILGAVIFLIYFLSVFDSVLNFGNIVGMAVGGAIIASSFVLNKISASAQNTLETAVFAVIIAMAVGMDIIYTAGRTDAKNESVIIVLGCKVRGTTASRALEGRVETAFRFLISNPDSSAILSGGRGRGEDISEAECMYRMLTQRGIDASRLFKEDKSTSTRENIAFSLKIIEQRNMSKNVAVATSEYHQKRTKIICEKFGLTPAAQSSKTKKILLPTFLLREIAAVIKESIIK